MIRTIITIHIVQFLIALMLMNSGQISGMINRSYAHKSNKLVLHRYVQISRDSLFIGIREEELQAHHKNLGWSVRITYPFQFNVDKNEEDKFRFGVSVVTHDKPHMSKFKAIYIHIKYWLIAVIVTSFGSLLWADKWLHPLKKKLKLQSSERMSL